MKSSPMKYILPMALVFVALAIILYFLNPRAPLLLVASLLIQVPLVWMIIRSSYSEGYRNRVQTRREKYAKDNDAATWLVQEQKEQTSQGYRYLSGSCKNANTLNRAELLLALHKPAEAAALLAELDPKKLEKTAKEQYHRLALQQEAVLKDETPPAAAKGTEC